MKSHLKAILAGGLVAGTVDIGSAALINSASPVVICRAIAAGVLGAGSFEQGGKSAVLGLLLQWGMAIIIAAIYDGAVRIVPALRLAWITGGVIAGIITFFVMNYVVLPLSAIHHGPHFTPQRFLENLIAIILFALIIAWFARDAGPTSAAREDRTEARLG